MPQPLLALPAFHWKARERVLLHCSPVTWSNMSRLPPCTLGSSELPPPSPWPSFASPLPSCYTLQTHSKVHISAFSAKLRAVSRRLASKQSVHRKMSSWNKSSIREKRLGDCKKDPVFNLLYLRRLEHTLYIRITTSPATLQRVTGEYDKCKSSVISTVSPRGAACCPRWGWLPRNSRLVLDSCSRRRRPTGCS